MIIIYLDLNNMPLLQWKSENSVGVKELDDQHKKIFSIINKLAEVMETAQANKVIKIIFKELNDYIIYHFSTEEKYFEEFSYSEAEDHIRSHKEFKNKIEEFNLRKEETSISFEVIDFLEDWWIDHINGTDKKYTKCFNEHGLK